MCFRIRHGLNTIGMDFIHSRFLLYALTDPELKVESRLQGCMKETVSTDLDAILSLF